MSQIDIDIDIQIFRFLWSMHVICWHNFSGWQYVDNVVVNAMQTMRTRFSHGISVHSNRNGVCVLFVFYLQLFRV